MTNVNEGIKDLPYGISDYGIIRRENYYYVDKTAYLEKVQKAGRYLFFIRPRRFGKSLFLSMMAAYYDVYYKDRFEELFGGTFIYENPTEERGVYLVLALDFSGVDPAADNIETSFLKHIRTRALSFLRKYSDFLIKDKEYYKKTIEESRSSADILSMINDLTKDSHRQLYVIIDEYDNFANTVLSTSGESAYQNLTHGEGFFRSFFNVIKTGTSGMDAPIVRLFITGVSPLTLDDVTSGFNIGKNISLEPIFNRMLGFSRDDVIDIIEYYREKELIQQPVDDLLEIMTEWYGHYLFSEDDDERMFNSDMVLYFLDHYLSRQKLPKDLIDKNVRIDYGKLRYLITIDSEKGRAFNGNFSRLKDIIEEGEISSELVEAFPLEKLEDTKNFISLLFYFGLLTIKDVEPASLVFTVPNETIRRLFYDFIKEGYEETDIFALDLYTYSRLMKRMAMEGEWKPLFEYITGRMRESMSLRDLITGEKSVQAFLNVYLGLSNLYIIHSERELQKGYADIVMEPFLARYGAVKYSYLLEIKYLKSGSQRKIQTTTIQQLKEQARKQLNGYSLDEKLRKNTAKTTLVKLVLIFSGHELIYIGEIN